MNGIFTLLYNVNMSIFRLYSGLSEMPMIDYPVASTFLAPVPPNLVNVACKSLNNPHDSDEHLVC